MFSFEQWQIPDGSLRELLRRSGLTALAAVPRAISACATLHLKSAEPALRELLASQGRRLCSPEKF